MKYLALKVAKLDFRAVRAVNSYGHRAPTNSTLSVNDLFCSSDKTGDPSLHEDASLSSEEGNCSCRTHSLFGECKKTSGLSCLLLL